jgi:hypothetical protein
MLKNLPYHVELQDSITCHFSLFQFSHITGSSNFFHITSFSLFLNFQIKNDK